MKGKLYRNWPENKEIVLINCIFKPGINKRNFSIQTNIKANDKKEACILGKEICKDAVNLLEFCIGEKVELSNKFKEIKEISELKTDGIANPLCGFEIVRDEPLTSEQLEKIEEVQSTLLIAEEEQKLIIIKSLHWWSLGKRESDNIDRFIKLWIALEVLVEGEGEKVVNKVTKDLKELYSSFDQRGGKELVGRIYGMRGNIVHRGFRDPRDVMEKTQQLEAILEDLLSLHLNTKFKGLTREYLNLFSQ